MVVVGFPGVTNVHVYFNPEVKFPMPLMTKLWPGLTSWVPMSAEVEWQLMLIAWVMSFSKVTVIPCATAMELVSSTRIIAKMSSAPPFEVERFAMIAARLV